MKKTVCTVIPALVAGIAIGFAGAKLTGGGRETPAAENKSVKKVTEVKRGLEDNSDVRALRARILELERRRVDAGDRNGDASDDDGSERPRRGGPELNFRERLEKMRVENPEQYAQHTNSIARWRDSRRNHAASRLEFLSSIDTSTMSAAEKKTHVRLQNLIEEREELQTRFDERWASGEMSDEERREIWGRMRDADRQMAELNAAERENLIKKTAEAVGFTGEDVGEIAGTIMKVIEATESNPRNRSRRGRGGNGGHR